MTNLEDRDNDNQDCVASSKPWTESLRMIPCKNIDSSKTTFSSTIASSDLVNPKNGTGKNGHETKSLPSWSQNQTNIHKKDHSLHNTIITNDQNHSERKNDEPVTVLSWNVLAQSYTSPRSQKDLPPVHHAAIFGDPKERCRAVANTLVHLAESNDADVICVQELDGLLIEWGNVVKVMQDRGYDVVHAPRGEIGGCTAADIANLNDEQRSSTNAVPPETNVKVKKSFASVGCAIFYQKNKWSLEDTEVVHFDDLSSEYRPPLSSLDDMKNLDTDKEPNMGYKDDGKQDVTNGDQKSGRKGSRRPSYHALSGIAMSYRRNNTALMILIQRKSSLSSDQPTIKSNNTKEINDINVGQMMAIGCAHLYWHPGYEYVKLGQAKYLLHKMDRFASIRRIITSRGTTKTTNMNSNGKERVPIMLCGDFNSKPDSTVHNFLTKGTVNASEIAPWYRHYNPSQEEEKDILIDNPEGDNHIDQDLEQDPIIPLPSMYEDSENDCQNNIKSFHIVNNQQDKQSDDDLLNRLTADMAISDNTDTKDSNLNPGGNKNLPSYRKVKNKINDKNKSPSLSFDSYSMESVEENDKSHSVPTMRYLLDHTLNKFTRWLRILGIDAALETDVEEKARTQQGDMVIFRRCRAEKRTLITTSYKLLLRKDCPPGAYLININKTVNLEDCLVHLLLLHGVILQPRKILTRCVVCNGSIIEVQTEEEREHVLKQHGCESLLKDNLYAIDLDHVYKCDKCGQGYWWSDEPKSSASRVKNAATHLLLKCLEGGLQIEGGLDYFENHIDVENLRKGWKSSNGNNSETKMINSNGGVEEIVSWLRQEELDHPFDLRSAYALERGNEILGELLPFTNVTSEFIGTLDYIFYQPKQFNLLSCLHVPRTLRELNSINGKNGHLLPSNLWPSDHLAIGARFELRTDQSTLKTFLSPDERSAIKKDKKGEQTSVSTKTNFVEKNHMSFTSSIPSAYIPESIKLNSLPIAATVSEHRPQCDCGCVPNILSLFEMAELRKKARQKASTKNAVNKS